MHFHQISSEITTEQNAIHKIFSLCYIIKLTYWRTPFISPAFLLYRITRGVNKSQLICCKHMCYKYTLLRRDLVYGHRNVEWFARLLSFYLCILREFFPLFLSLFVFTINVHTFELPATRRNKNGNEIYDVLWASSIIRCECYGLFGSQTQSI